MVSAAVDSSVTAEQIPVYSVVSKPVKRVGSDEKIHADVDEQTIESCKVCVFYLLIIYL